MAHVKRVAIIVHEHDPVLETAGYNIRYIADEWRRAGLEVVTVRGPGAFVEADVAVLHVDLTVVPDEYVDLAARYPRTLNGAVRDISKRRVSSGLVLPGDGYEGPVLVKSDRNHGGRPEGRSVGRRRRLAGVAERLSEWLPWRFRRQLDPYGYTIFASPAAVPAGVWGNPRLVVQQFRPERRADGAYGLRRWTFMGDREYGGIAWSRFAIVKSSNSFAREPVASPPPALREIRRRLGFDYGKFDYALVDGEVFLYDANRTPTTGSLPHAGPGAPRLPRPRRHGGAGARLTALLPRTRPALTLGEIYGPGHVLSGRLPPRAAEWLTPDLAARDALTGAQLAVLGDLSALVNRGAATPAGLELLRDAGFAIDAEALHLFDADGDDYLAKLGALARAGRRIVLNHVHPVDELDPRAYWVPRDLMSFLNDKGNLADVVPDRHAVPRREVVPPGALASCIDAAFPLPAVVKASSPWSSGGGFDVAICRTPDDVRRAALRFAGCARIVVEEHLCLVRNVCLNYAVRSEGRVVFIGAAEQVCDAEGRFDGSWLGGEPLPAVLVDLGRRIVERGADLGWRGVAGLDAGIAADGRAVAFDLNFRLNASTAPLLVFEPGERASVARFRRFTGAGEAADVVRAARTALERGLLVPLAVHDPDAAGRPGARPRVAGLVAGASRDEVAERLAEMRSLGLT
jgi:hypothetical protein